MILKGHQLLLDVDAQIENLKSLGLVIEDEDSAKAFLNKEEHKKQAYGLRG